MQVVSDRYSALWAAIYVPSLLAESVQALECYRSGANLPTVIRVSSNGRTVVFEAAYGGSIPSARTGVLSSKHAQVCSVQAPSKTAVEDPVGQPVQGLP